MDKKWIRDAIVRYEIKTGLLASAIKIEKFLGGYHSNTNEEVAEANRNLALWKHEWHWYQKAVAYLEGLLPERSETDERIQKKALDNVLKEQVQQLNAREKNGKDQEIKILRAVIKTLKMEGSKCAL